MKKFIQNLIPFSKPVMPQEEADNFTSSVPSHQHTNTSRVLNVVELFQSQGCSSCPPANAEVIKLAGNPEHLVLTYEVTYWDHLGWPDTFGNNRWNERQRDYGRALGRKSAFTPQVIVNGRADGVGNSAKGLQKILNQGKIDPEHAVSVTCSQGSISLDGDAIGKSSVLAVYYQPNPADVVISRGENNGRTLPHRNVVRDLKHVGTWSGGVQTFQIPEPDSDLDVAVLIQARRGGPIIGAGCI